MNRSATSAFRYRDHFLNNLLRGGGKRAEELIAIHAGDMLDEKSIGEVPCHAQAFPKETGKSSDP